mmetsp:Transcript_18931/g.28355  ORF Transcript_18931/g.28355 Transcript_18931/m.28355 type:complete len:471 (-) Transcript_18931:30-1442(-)
MNTVQEDDSVLAQAIRSSLGIDTASNDDHSNSLAAASAASSRSTSTSTTVLNPIYVRTASGNDIWELTWPIWHMLPVEERKDIAKQNGFRSIGEFEESVILSRALKEDVEQQNAQQQQQQQQQTSGQNQIQPYANEDLYEMENRPQNFGLPILAERSETKEKEDDDDDGGDDNSESSSSSSDYNEGVYDVSKIPQNSARIKSSKSKNKSSNPQNQKEDGEDGDIDTGGYMILLPNELIVHFILPFLPIEQYATCALVSPHWKNFTRTELVYKELCKRCYLQQSKRKTLHVHRFNGSYHTMLNSRFRVKTGCGFYVLKCTKIKKIQRDMWTEIPVGAILESTYYRYMNFFEDGNLLYALSSKPPHEIIPIFRQMKENGSESHSAVNAVLGKYIIQKDKVTVNVTHPWHHVRLVLNVLTNGYPGSVGRFWALELTKHWSSKSGDFDEYWSRDLVEYKVPSEPIFRFLRDWRL